MATGPLIGGATEQAVRFAMAIMSGGAAGRLVKGGPRLVIVENRKLVVDTRIGLCFAPRLTRRTDAATVFLPGRPIQPCSEVF